MTTASPICSRIFPLLFGMIALGVLALPACKRPNASAPPVSSAPPSSAAAPAVVGPNVSKVKGRWLRPDGGYQLVIGAIADDGRAEAGYFNPNPIRVAWARVKAEGSAVKIDVELRDENYPGCLYKLTFMPDTDRLLGTYFQAQTQQIYEVEFVRLP